ncbi:MAG: HAD family phosphatase [Lentimicrobium sp.]|nr:HAD family phosphatase [Lentimicrobium sp.]
MDGSVSVIFDMDGVLVDNFAWHLLAWETFCKRHKKHISADEFRNQVFGGNNPDHLKYIFGSDISKQLIEEYSLEKESIYRELYAGNVIAVKGLAPFLQELRENRIPIAIATSAERTNVDFILEAIGCVGTFDQIVDSSMIREGKPQPEVFLKAASLLQSKPEECVIFEDSLKGIEAGLRAQMKVVGVATTHYYAELTEAHKVITDFTDISLKDLRLLVKNPS